MIIQPGTDIGRYHILEMLGEGGMARVYKALDTNLKAEVAIKFIRVDDLPMDQIERTIESFRVEAKKMAGLSHSNIVSISDFGEYKHTPYLVMPLLHGGSLKKYIGAQMEWRAAAGLIAPIAEALDYTHRKGIIHCDVKPANILLTESGDPMLTDFGIAKIIDVAEARQLTLTGSIIGTPEYMAPEQYISTKFDKRVDIYALGIVLYELITGRKPFIADTPPAVMIKHARDPLPRPKNFVPGLPDEVEWLLMKALVKQPKDRYKNMRTMAEELRRLASLMTEEEQRIAEKELFRQEQIAKKRAEEEKLRKEAKAKQTAEKAAKEREKREKERRKEQVKARAKKSASEGQEKKPKLRIDKKRAFTFGGLALLALGLVGIVLLGIQIQDVLREIRPAGKEDIQSATAVPDATDTVEPTIAPASSEPVYPTETPDLAQMEGLTGEELIWEGEDQIGDIGNGTFDIVSAKAVFTPPDDFTVEIFFTEIPETLELGAQDETEVEDTIEYNWAVFLDTDNDSTTGIEAFDNNTGREIPGIDLEFWIANIASRQQTINLNTFTAWDVRSVMVPDSSDGLIVSKNIDFEFNTDDNILTMKGNISNILPDARVIVSFDQYVGYGMPNADSLELEPITASSTNQTQQPTATIDLFASDSIKPLESEPESSSDGQTTWLFVDATNDQLEPIVDLVSGEAFLDGSELTVKLFLEDVPKNYYINRTAGVWSLLIFLDYVSYPIDIYNPDFEYRIWNEIITGKSQFEWVNVSEGLKWAGIRIISPDGYFYDFPSSGTGNAFFDTEENSLTFEITDESFSQDMTIVALVGDSTFDEEIFDTGNFHRY